jgi:hypothetical protein
MVMAGCGFRTENYSGSGERSLYWVIRHEISMGNTDIVVYLQATAKILLDYTAECAEDLSCICQENAADLAADIVAFVESKLGVHDIHAVWLTTLADVVALYNGNSNNGIDQYCLPSRYVILSDLGNYGALFAYPANDTGLIKNTLTIAQQCDNISYQNLEARIHESNYRNRDHL